METIEVTAEISNHHLHLSEADMKKLLDSSHGLTIKKNLSQPGQYACEETVTLVGPKGKVDDVRILGPTRDDSQIELSTTDAIRLGVNAPVRDSGNLTRTPGIDVVYKNRKVKLRRGVMIAQRHIHASVEQANKYGLRDKEIVKVRVDGPRGGEFHNVLVRVSPKANLDFHIDTDEGNAFGIKNGDQVTVIKEH